MEHYIVTGMPIDTIDSSASLWTPIISAIVGAAAGALLGALTTYYIGNREREKQLDIAKFSRQRAKFILNNKSVQNMQANLNMLMFNVMGNKEALEDLSTGMYDKATGGALLSVNLPSIYELGDNCDDVLNAYLSNRWNNLITESKIQNKNIQEFNEYYAQLRSHIIGMLIKGQRPNSINLEQNSNVIVNSLDGKLKATEVYRQKCLHIYGTLELFIEWYTKTNTRDFEISLEFTNHIDKMMEWEPEAKELKKRVGILSKQYVAGKAYTSTRVISKK